MTITNIAQIHSLSEGSLIRVQRQIREGHERACKGGQEWIEGTLELAQAMHEARSLMPANIEFSRWLKDKGLNFYGKIDRSALLKLAADLPLLRTILTETKSVSFRVIWKENKNRYRGSQPGTTTSTVPKTVRRYRNLGRAMLHREMKLGEQTVASLKGTTLEIAAEMDALIFLNRGAEEGEHTEIVKQLVRDATAGKKVSAVAVRKTTSFGTPARRHEPLIEAFDKRMTATWELSNKAEREAFIEYLMSKI